MVSQFLAGRKHVLDSHLLQRRPQCPSYCRRLQKAGAASNPIHPTHAPSGTQRWLVRLVRKVTSCILKSYFLGTEKLLFAVRKPTFRWGYSNVYIRFSRVSDTMLAESMYLCIYKTTSYKSKYRMRDVTYE